MIILPIPLHLEVTSQSMKKHLVILILTWRRVSERSFHDVVAPPSTAKEKQTRPHWIPGAFNLDGLARRR